MYKVVVMFVDLLIAACHSPSKNETVTLEGNCDERGSDECNLALGQRRADAVKKLLVAAGVHAHQIKTASLGKQKPKATWRSTLLERRPQQPKVWQKPIRMGAPHCAMPP